MQQKQLLRTLLFAGCAEGRMFVREKEREKHGICWNLGKRDWKAHG